MCAIVVSMTVLAVPVAGIIGAVTNSSAAAPKETVLRIGFMQKIDSLNPYVGYSDSAYVFYGLVYDAMEVIDNDMNPVPDLALSCWSVNNATDPKMIASGEPYGSVWEYNLTDKAVFSDGQPMTADDVIFNVNLNAGNYTNMWAYQPYSYYMKYAEKMSDYQVRIHFFDRDSGNPAPAAYAYIISLPILPKYRLSGMLPQDIGFNWTGVYDDVATVGTGPFMGSPTLYDDWFKGEQLTLVRNPNSHWMADFNKNISFDKVKLVFYDESTAMALALEKGDLDVAQFPPGAYQQLKKEVTSGKLKNVATYDGPRITQYWTEVGFNMNEAGGPNPTRCDIAVRQALAMATDKEHIVEQYYLGYAEPGTTLIPPFNTKWHYNLTADELFPTDYQAARDLLQASGYRDIDGDGIREVTASSLSAQKGWGIDGKTELSYEMMVRREYPEEKIIAQYLAGEWRQIGVNLIVDTVDEVTLNSEVYYYQYDSMLWYWSADIDPNYQLFVQTKAAWGGWSDNMYYNESYDDNYTKSVQTMDPVLRHQYTDECQRVNYRDAGYIILAYVNQTYAWRTDTFTGWGDWANDPGRSLDNFWMGNPLYFDLIPTPRTNGGSPPWALIGAGVAGVAAVIVAVAFLNKKGKLGKKKSDETSPLGD